MVNGNWQLSVNKCLTRVIKAVMSQLVCQIQTKAGTALTIKCNPNWTLEKYHLPYFLSAQISCQLHSSAAHRTISINFDLATDRLNSLLFEGYTWEWWSHWGTPQQRFKSSKQTRVSNNKKYASYLHIRSSPSYCCSSSLFLTTSTSNTVITLHSLLYGRPLV